MTASRPHPLAVPTLCLAQFVDVLGVTVVVTALPTMLRDLGAPASAATPVVTGYAMFFGGLLMLGARLGDRYGHRRVLLAGLGTFGVGSLLAALTPSLTLLVVARCLQGVAAAASVPCALRLLSTSATDEDRRRRALAAWSATGAVAGASGLLLGGLLTDAVSWRLIFWLNLPLSVVLVLAVLRAVPRGEPTARRHLDLPGAALLTVVVMGVVLGSALFEQPPRRLLGGGLVLAGLLVLVAFVLVERRSRSPLVPGSAVRNPRLRLGSAVSFLNTALTSSTIVLATLYLQDTRNVSPTRAGLTLLPFSAMVVLAASVVAPRLLRRLGPRATTAVGLGLLGLGDAGLVAGRAALWLLPVSVGVAGFGLGLSSVAATTIGTDVPEDLAGTAAGLLNTAAQLGTALGVAVAVLLASLTSGWAIGGPAFVWIAAGAAGLASALLVSRVRLPDDASARRPYSEPVVREEQ